MARPGAPPVATVTAAVLALLTVSSASAAAAAAGAQWHHRTRTGGQLGLAGVPTQSQWQQRHHQEDGPQGVRCPSSASANTPMMDAGGSGPRQGAQQQQRHLGWPHGAAAASRVDLDLEPQITLGVNVTTLARSGSWVEVGPTAGRTWMRGCRCRRWAARIWDSKRLRCQASGAGRPNDQALVACNSLLMCANETWAGART